MLIDGIGLEFESVSTELDGLEFYDPTWWALGKLWTYRLQTEPFVHIDSDVFLWKRLPERLEKAPVVAQNPEHFTGGVSFYKPELIEYYLKRATDGWLPEEWQWYRLRGGIQNGSCCGIMGGNHIDFINHYASTAITLITHPTNERGWYLVGDKSDHNILAEQYLLTACVEFHCSHSDSPFSDLRIEYLFGSVNEAHDRNRALRAGYTHMLSSAKRHELLCQRLEKRVETDFPDCYDRCIRYLSA
jgi:hypothetical protein